MKPGSRRAYTKILDVFNRLLCPAEPPETETEILEWGEDGPGQGSIRLHLQEASQRQLAARKRCGEAR